MKDEEDSIEEPIEISESEPESLLEEQKLDPKEINDLLFLVQNLGCTKSIGNVETYVKNKDCIEFLKELYKLLRSEHPDSTLKRLELGEWNVVESDLLKLLISYPDDHQITFYTILLLTSLTEKSPQGHSNPQQYLESLQSYKLSFITSKDSLKIIVNLLAECLSQSQAARTEQHEQTLELIVYLFRNLLAVPDSRPSLLKNSRGLVIYNSREDNFKDLQRRFLHKLSDETVLDAFVYMTQDMTAPFAKKINLAFLEIMHQIFSGFKPRDMWGSRTGDLKDLLGRELELQKHQLRNLGSRHSKFGSSFVKRRSLGASALVFSNLFTECLAFNKAPNQQTQPKRRPQVHTVSLSAQDGVQTDRSLLEKIKLFANDVLEHSFGPLIESVFVEFYKNSGRLEDEDHTYNFLFQAFMFEFCRRKQDAQGGGASLDVSPIAEALKLQHFEFLYRTMTAELKKTSKKEMRTRELHAGIRLMIQTLYVMRDMAVASVEQTRKNAQILLQNVFYHEIARVCRRSFDYWILGMSDKAFLEELCEFSYITFSLLSAHSKGKSLTVRTGRVLKSHARGSASEDEDSTEYQTRQLSYFIEFSQMIEHDIVSKYCFLLRSFRENSDEVNGYICDFIEKVVVDCAADWVFFQLEHLVTFYNVLKDASAPRYSKLYSAVSDIVARYFQLFQRNKLLLVESLFVIKEKTVKDMILHNYQPTELPQQIAVPSKSHWSKQEDLTLIDHYDTFKDNDKAHEIIAGFLKPKTAHDIRRRVKELKLKKGPQAALHQAKLLHLREDTFTAQDTPKCFESLGESKVLAFLAENSHPRTITPTEENIELLDNPELQSLLLYLGFEETAPLTFRSTRPFSLLN